MTGLNTSVVAEETPTLAAESRKLSASERKD
jgi:hypothetical protein